MKLFVLIDELIKRIMLKVYFDTNLYSQIASGQVDELFHKLEERADVDILFLYSQAHLNDLGNDRTDRKFMELDVISRYAKDNFLEESNDTNRVNTIKVYPRQAFNEFYASQESISELLSTSLDPTGIPQVDVYLEAMKSQEVDLGPEVEKHLLDDKNPEARKIYNEVGIYKRRYKMEEWMDIALAMMNRFETDDRLIKLVRRESMRHLEVDKLNIKIGEIKFDENLAKSKIGKTYSELLEQQIEALPKNSDTLFNRITTGFNLLNFLGLDYERNRKVKFKNTMNDAQHCYFGGVSDILVTNDVGLINKSKFIYSYHGVDTRVMSVEEFKKFIQGYSVKKFTSEVFFHSSLLDDRVHNLVLVPKRPIIAIGQYEQIWKLSKSYWGYFNRLSEAGFIDSEEESILLYKGAARTGFFVFYKEIDHIIKGLNAIFPQALPSIHKSDMDAISKGEWNGRLWESESNRYWLRFSPDTGRIVLQIEMSN